MDTDEIRNTLHIQVVRPGSLGELLAEGCKYPYNQDCRRPTAIVMTGICEHEHVGVIPVCVPHATIFLDNFQDWMCSPCQHACRMDWGHEVDVTIDDGSSVSAGGS